MHTRVTTISGARNIDGGVAHLREVVPQLQQQKGFRGVNASCDRAAGVVTILSLWETEADRDASESAIDKIRSDSATAFGGKTESVERYEQTAAEVGANTPGPGSKLQIRRIKMDPSRVDENVAFFTANVVPELMSAPGFQSLRQMINRATGEGVVGTVWADEESLNAAAAKADERRATAESRGVEFGEVTRREVLFAVRS